MNKLKVFHDGACHLCYREIKHYLKIDKKGLIEAIDITDANFKASDYGLDAVEVDISIHTIDDAGNVFKGIDSFIEIWKRVPPYQYLIPIFNNHILRPLFDRLYILFARQVRPRLPKRNCDTNCSIKI